MEAAICRLSHLVEEFRNFVSEREGDDPYDKSDVRPTSALSLDRCMEMSQPCKSEIEEEESSTTSEVQSEDHKAKPFVYQNAIRMPHSLAFDKNRDSLMSSIFLFNLALAHHLRADAITNVDDPNNLAKRHLLLSKALKIYELAFKMQERGGYFNCNFLFILAILNNIGVIHQTLGAPQQAKRCFGKVMSVLMLMTDRKCHDTTKLEMNGFFRNASCSLFAACSAAAA